MGEEIINATCSDEDGHKRLAELDELVRDGWGDVPQTYIPENWRSFPPNFGHILTIRFRTHLAMDTVQRGKLHGERDEKAIWRRAIRETMLPLLRHVQAEAVREEIQRFTREGRGRRRYKVA